jgi:hypothetical protein
MGNWQPDETSWVEHRPAYLWIVPANAGGTWKTVYAGADGAVEAELSVEQVFQQVKGSLDFGAIRTGMRSPRLAGSRLLFEFTDAAGALRQVDARVDGDRMQGTIHGPGGSRDFAAMRQGAAPPVRGSAAASADEHSNALQLLGE